MGVSSPIDPVPGAIRRVNIFIALWDRKAPRRDSIVQSHADGKQPKGVASDLRLYGTVAKAAQPLNITIIVQ